MLSDETPGPITLLTMLFLSTAVASVFANGYAPDLLAISCVSGLRSIHCIPPGSSGAAAALTGPQATGILSLTYLNGFSATISLSTVMLHLCTAAGCTTVSATWPRPAREHTVTSSRFPRELSVL